MLHYSRKEATGEIHDPISFKPFSEHSHIVAIATTGNVFLAESIKGGRDLVAEVPFKKCVCDLLLRIRNPQLLVRTDVITLQNPHGLPSISVPNPSTATTSTAQPKDGSAKVALSPAVGAVKAKESVPCNLVASSHIYRCLTSRREHFSLFKWDGGCIINFYIC